MTDGSQTPPEKPDAPAGWLPPSAPGSQPTTQWHQGDPTAVHQQPAVPPGSPPPGFGAPLGQPPVGPPTYPPPAPGYGWAPQPAAPSRPTNGKAIASLIVGIGSLSFALLFFGLLFILTIPGGIVAWVLGVQGRKAAASGPDDDLSKPGGRGLAQAGMWCGIASVVISVLTTVFWALIFTLGDVNWDELQQADPDPDNFFSSFVRASAVLARGALTLT